MLTSSETKGAAVFQMAQEVRFSEICELFAPPLRPMVTPEVLGAGWSAELDRLGPVSSISPPISEPAPAGSVVVKIPVTCERGSLTFVVSMNAGGSRRHGCAADRNA